MRVNVVGALIVLLVTHVSPDGNVLDGDVCAWHACWAVDVDWWSLSAICTVTGPVREGNTVVKDTVPGLNGLATPVAIDIERIGILVANEVFQKHVCDSPVATVVFKL